MKKVVLMLLSFLILFAAVMPVTAKNYYQVQDPHRTWRRTAGAIEEAVITVKPLGAYFQFEIYFTFSAKGTSFTSSNDALEIQYFFDLPVNSHIVDAWLWVGDTIIKAMLIEKGTAYRIYEGIVSRRRDPLILYKQSQTQYEMRIYPLAGNSVRRAKITYMVPADWSAEYVAAQLPLFLINMAKVKPEKIKVINYVDDVWGIPEITGDSVYAVFDDLYPDFQMCKSVVINNSDFGKAVTVKYKAPFKNGVFVTSYEDLANEGYYNLVMLPSVALDFYNNKNILFLIDYDVTKSNITPEELFANLRMMIKRHMNPSDSFNIIFSRLDAEPVSESWIQASDENIDNLFENLDRKILSYYSTLQWLLPKGLDYINAHEGKGAILLIANSDALGSYKVANPLIDLIEQKRIYDTQINIIDYITNYELQYYNYNKYQDGNAYLYKYLSAASGGFFLDIRNFGKSFDKVLDEGFKRMDGAVNSFELNIMLDNGFCYAKFYLPGYQNVTYNDKPFVQIGRWVGEFPIKITATGFYGKKAFLKNIMVGDSDICRGNKRARQIWHSQYINYLEHQTKDNSIISQIIEESRDNRILSLYTAFLALEPNIKVEDEEEEGPTSVSSKIDNQYLQVKAYPNPFREKLYFDINLKDKSIILQSIEIYNMSGVKVRTLNPGALNSNLKLTWDGRDETGMKLPAGVYLIKFNTLKGVFILRVVMVK